VGIFLCIWTVLIAVALWWLLRAGAEPGASGPWVLHPGSASGQSFAEKARDWLRLVDLNFQRIYPWILLGPYVAWLGLNFELERGRLRASIPVHLAACAVFVLSSYAINSRSGLRTARVVVITSFESEHRSAEESTNRMQVEVSNVARGDLGEELKTRGVFAHKFARSQNEDVLTLRGDEFWETGVTNQGSNFFKHFPPSMTPPELPSMRPLSTLLDLFAYGAILGVAQSVHFYRRYREREHRALLLESNLAQARLSALQAQLHPHFLFNSLNAVVTLLRRDPRLAEATLTSLSDLLRWTLSQSGKQEVLLREEIQLVERYLEIQKTRFGDRLRCEQAVEPSTLNCRVPTLLLQPLVENAIRHGIEPSEDAGLLRLSARREGNRLVIEVEDDGVGLKQDEVASIGPEDAKPRSEPTETAREPARLKNQSLGAGKTEGTGIGLANLRARLEALYGPNQKLTLNSRTTGGLMVHVEVPWSTIDPATVRPENAAE
jgi:signal transduction histidine kinase